ncbi:MAG: glycoside hydrolase family 2 TIM barrel-domain containing protein [Candidatus Acidiferrales bacterium]
MRPLPIGCKVQWVLGMLLFLPGLANAQSRPAPANLIANVGGRTSISLNGAWNAIVDPYETGLGARYYENRKAANKSDLVEYDFDSSGTLNVPGDWNTQREKLFFYEGPIWYEKNFSYHKRGTIRSFVYFGAANYQARVYLNGKKIGEHTGGFTPFNFEVSGDLRDGDNFLVVEVNNQRRSDGVPALNTDWWNYGGLTRDVAIVETPETFIQDYFLQLAKGSADELAGWVKLSGAAQAQTVNLEIPDAGVRKSITTDASGYAEFRFSAATLQLWSPETPKLYRVVLSSGDDRVEDQIGFRTVETRGTQISLNGKPLFLRGISMHEEAPFRSGRAFSAEDAGMLLGWAKELGCNFVRMAHYPYNENMIRAADRMGILLWEEVPVYWDIDWENPGTLALAEEQMRDVVARDDNRAAVILWSVGNETPVKAPRTEFLKQLAAYYRQLDATRLITAALNRPEKIGPDTRVLNDPLGEYLDVIGLNEYLGWYEGLPEDAGRAIWKFAYEKPLIVSEFGAGALYGDHGDAETRFTEEFQVRVYRQQIEMLKRIPSLAGMTPWVLTDFLSPRRPLPGKQDFYNRKGLISNRGERKQAFYLLQEFYRKMAATGPTQPSPAVH